MFTQTPNQATKPWPRPLGSSRRPGRRSRSPLAGTSAASSCSSAPPERHDMGRLDTTRKAVRLLVLAAFALAVLAVPSAQATPGALDPSFGTGGKVTTAISSSDDQAYALALQPDGKLVAAGYSDNGSTYAIE